MILHGKEIPSAMRRLGEIKKKEARKEYIIDSIIIISVISLALIWSGLGQQNNITLWIWHNSTKDY